MDTDQPCQWYESIEKPDCPNPGTVRITVKSKITKAKIFVCTTHKKVHDDNFARARAATRR